MDLDKYNNVFLVDISWHFYRSYYTFSKLKSPLNKPIGHLFGMTRFIQTALTYPNSAIVLCEDGVPIRRKQLNEDYKANRSFLYDFHADLPLLDKLTTSIPDVFSVYNYHEEADDLLFTLSRPDSPTFYIFCGDNDLLQALKVNTLITRSVSINHIETITPNSEYYQSHFPNIQPTQLPLYRAIKRRFF